MSERAACRGRLLVVEDEPYVRASLDELLRARGYDVCVENTAEAAMQRLARAPFDALLTDLKLPGADGIELVRRARAAFPEIPVLVLTGYGTIASAVECIKAGACDYILKPADPDALEASFERALATTALEREVKYLRENGEGRGPGGPEGDADFPVGRSPAWLEAMRLVRAGAPSDSTILFLGESGTGKELLARMVHRLSPRAAGPFVRVNCAATPLEMWESEFFGHRRGSYTGASSDREGRFRLAHRGTLFMDEIGAMPHAAQAKILRVLEDGEFDRLGDEQPTRVDVRIVAATNSDLDSEVAAGRFRQDLFYRLNVLRIEVPPLRRRIEDVPALTEHFVRRITARLGRLSPSIGDGVMADLMAYSWPGNVRELRNVIERALILNPGGTLETLDLPPVQGLSGARPEGSEAGAYSELNLRAAVTAREKEALLEALRRSCGVRKEAARLLGIDQRNLAYYLKKHGVDPAS